MLKLLTCFRSSAAYRLRIALNLKNLPCEAIPAHLIKDGVPHLSAAYRRIRPATVVTSLADRDLTLSQSLAIIEYLDETYPYPPLLPGDPTARARVRSIALDVACEIHPLNNRHLLKFLSTKRPVSEKENIIWFRHWVETGLSAVEAHLAESRLTGRFCHGEHPTLADCCLVPQVENARRFECSLEHVPTVLRIDAECRVLKAFVDAAPENQLEAD